jgi:hypothetical protein
MSQRVGRVRFDDAGQMAGIEAIPFGFLMFVAGALLLANAWAVVDAKLAVSAAAREASRAYVEASTVTDAELAALAAAESSIAGHGHDPTRLALAIVVDGGFGRCVRVVTEAAIDIPSVHLPFIGGFGRTFAVRAEHAEVVDPYRSGLTGEVQCAS